jgi:hypothetical protein
MSTIPKYLEELNSKLEKSYPEMLNFADLIELGIFRTSAAISIAVAKGYSPPYIRVSSKKVLFPKKPFFEWISEKYESHKEKSNG